MLRTGIVAGIITLMASQAHALEPTITVKVENTSRTTVLGVTNLPDRTKLLISIRRSQSSYFAQANAEVLGGSFRGGPFSQSGQPLNPGSYNVEIFMPLAMAQPESVKEIIGRDGEKLSGPLVKRGSLGVTAAVTLNFTIGAGADPNLDAQAKAAALKDLDRWIVESCNSNVDLVNGMVRQGLVGGKVLVGEQRTARVDGCIKELMQARSK